MFFNQFLSPKSHKFADVPEEGEVKLFYNSYNTDTYRGLLQLWLKGQWGTVYDDYWTVNDAKPVCRQLGRECNYFTLV